MVFRTPVGRWDRFNCSGIDPINHLSPFDPKRRDNHNSHPHTIANPDSYWDDYNNCHSDRYPNHHWDFTDSDTNPYTNTNTYFSTRRVYR